MATWKKIITTQDDADYKNSNVSVPSVQKHYMQWSVRWYTGAFPSFSGTSRRRWYHPNSTYGPSYYQWNSYYTNANPRTYWYDTYNPCIVIPDNMTLKKYELKGNFGLPSGTNTCDLLLELKTNTNALDWDGSSQSIPLTTVGTRQTHTWDKDNYNSLAENLTLSMDQGDILIPFLARDGLLTSSTAYYIEGVFMLEFEKTL